ncbi:hypothetical protein V4C53_39885 [Paraburkholderia azotifigens]|uniref:hypothetical protein n=1 Tax=Paraburkholderia azotifigens TaxID=2057004 RepID=UPI003173BD33
MATSQVKACASRLEKKGPSLRKFASGLCMLVACLASPTCSAATYFLYEPSVAALSYDEQKQGVELKFGVNFLKALMVQQLREDISQSDSFENVSVSITPQPGPPGGSALTFAGDVKGRLKQRFAGNPIDIDCQLSFALAIEDQPLTESTLKVKRPDHLFNSCTVNGDLARFINLGSVLRDALNAAERWVPEQALFVAIGQKIFSNPDALDRFCRMWLIHAMINDIRVGTTNCVLDGAPAFCLNANWPAATLALKQGTLLSGAPRSKGPARGISQKLEAHWRSFAPVAPADPAVPCGHPVDLNGPNHDGIPSKAGCETGDMALFGGLLCASGEEAGCRLVAQAQSADGRFWRSPRLREQANQDNEFSGDMMLGVIHWGISSRSGNAIRSWRAYMASHVVSVPSGVNPAIPFARACEHDSAGTCNVGADNWLLVNTLAKVLSLPPVNVPEFDSAYSTSPAVLPLYAMVNEVGFRLHLVGVLVWAYQRLGYQGPEISLAARILAARQPGNPFFLYLTLGRDKVVQELVESKCPSLVTVPTSPTEWTWERDAGDNPGVNSMGWDCIFMANLLRRSTPEIRKHRSKSEG